MKIIQDEKLHIIGVSAFATTGKDTFSLIAKDFIEKSGCRAHLFNLAHELKIIANSIVRPHLGIDCLHASPSDKKRIRKILVGIGQGFRDIDENFWIKKVAEKISLLDLNEENFAFIPDIRNPNEAEWIKSHKNGRVISLYNPDIYPPNEHEAENIPKIKREFSDVSVYWPHVEENILTSPRLLSIVRETLENII